MSETELVPVYLPRDYLEADAIRQHLGALDIPCDLEGEQQSGLSGSGYFANIGRWRIRLLVRREDAERVRQIIEAKKWPRYA